MSRTITAQAKLQTNLLRADSNADGAYFGCSPRETVVTAARVLARPSARFMDTFTFPGFHVADMSLSLLL